MTEPAGPGGGLRLPARSMGLKLLLVCGLALLMCVPALFVFGLLMDRTNRAEQVANEIGGLMGGRQTFLGPVLAVPWTAPPVAAVRNPDGSTAAPAPQEGVLVVFAERGSALVATRSEVRRRSLFSVPVYSADVSFSGRFEPAGAARFAPRGAVLDWTRAELLVGASDPRGARSDVVVTVGGRTLALAPAALVAESGLEGARNARGQPGDTPLRLFGARVAAAPDAPFDVTGRMTFTGARSVAVLAHAKATEATMRGDWDHPSFEGGFLPVSRRVAGGDTVVPQDGGGPAAGIARGFEARWSVPFVARGVPEAGGIDLLSRLGATAMGVSFVEPANPYQSVLRSLKYALLFVGLVFLTYFIFETATGRRVHPAQYVLVGLAQIIFYLLLLAVAERLGFDTAFLIAAGATVLLISAYAGQVFGGLWRFVLALVLFTALYALIYVLMRLEDYALLVGAVASFLAIALVMFFTRRIDWYGVTNRVPAFEDPR